MLDMFLSFGANDRYRVGYQRLQPLDNPGKRVRTAIEEHQRWPRPLAMVGAADRDAARLQHLQGTDISTHRDFSHGRLALLRKQGQTKIVALRIRRPRHVIDVSQGALMLCESPGVVFDLFPLRYDSAGGLSAGPGIELFVMGGVFFEWRSLRVTSDPVVFGDFPTWGGALA